MKYLFWWIALMVLFGCGQFASNSLIGTWKAYLVTEGIDTIPADLSAVRLTLGTEQFTFQRSNIDSIKGRYFLKNNLLIMISEDPISPDTLKVQVLDSEGDEMKLRMNHQGVEQIVHLIRT